MTSENKSSIYEHWDIVAPLLQELTADMSEEDKHAFFEGWENEEN